ncbi:hypothetical protein ACTHSP_24060, partial [Neisseria sp. P0001.S005]|uniref:hypothetical protein n=1 Tax=Neisseria sp. P0001.S005 TaxID=3436649 RepID=UPI003F815739
VRMIQNSISEIFVFFKKRPYEYCSDGLLIVSSLHFQFDQTRQVGKTAVVSNLSEVVQIAFVGVFSTNGGIKIA